MFFQHSIHEWMDSIHLRMVMQIVAYPNSLPKVEELGVAIQSGLLLKLRTLWAALSWRKACHPIKGLLRRDTFEKVHFFTDCNKGCLFFDIILVTAFNHTYLLFPLTLPLGKLKRNPRCFPSGTSGKVNQQGLAPGNPHSGLLP